MLTANNSFLPNTSPAVLVAFGTDIVTSPKNPLRPEDQAPQTTSPNDECVLFTKLA